MGELKPRTADSNVVPTSREDSTAPKTRVRSSRFKYYIHDSVDACRLQLVGNITEAELKELDGCWRTAQTTLGKRRLILDVRELNAIDEMSRQWLARMASEGAVFQPESYLRTGLTPQPAGPAFSTSGFFGRLLSLFRGSRVLSAESSTQAQ